MHRVLASPQKSFRPMCVGGQSSACGPPASDSNPQWSHRLHLLDHHQPWVAEADCFLETCHRNSFSGPKAWHVHRSLPETWWAKHLGKPATLGPKQVVPRKVLAGSDDLLPWQLVSSEGSKWRCCPNGCKLQTWRQPNSRQSRWERRRSSALCGLARPDSVQPWPCWIHRTCAKTAKLWRLALLSFANLATKQNFLRTFSMTVSKLKSTHCWWHKVGPKYPKLSKQCQSQVRNGTVLISDTARPVWQAIYKKHHVARVDVHSRQQPLNDGVMASSPFP